ncbi:tRNA (adenosine(37)-N6)-dimethylallyltransferase MiaA [Candidatus Daviesbacteria bacterium]|nr:tRNA (adenosine(37)-N6)-dimethylallyltransferase MiaA [Candidatus Daviesbacteria bacterium]
MKKLLVILGPTSSGKTDLALKLAKKLNGEIIACDSRQVYKKLDLGTGKHPSLNTKVVKKENYWKIDEIKVHMYDLVDPSNQLNVSDYVKLANEIIKKVVKSKKLPIITGGTGLYLKALLQGFNNLAVPGDQKSRASLQLLTVSDLQKKLITLSLKKYLKMNSSDKQNKRRLIRAIEISSTLSKIINKKSSGLEKEFSILKIGLMAPRKIINENIDQRVILRVNQGLIEEARNLYKDGLSLARMRELGLEYGCLADFIEGKLTEKELVEKLKIKIHQFAKRQMTWFKKETKVYWFDISQKNFEVQLEKAILKWYYT